MDLFLFQYGMKGFYAGIVIGIPFTAEWIDTIGKKMTVCELYAKQNRHRGNVRHNTTKGRERLMKLLEADKLGSCPIDSVKLSDAKEWALRMKEKGTDGNTAVFV